MKYPAPNFAQIPVTKQFSQKFDLSQFIERDPASKENWAGVEYEIRTSQGKLLRSGVTDQNAITDHVFTENQESLVALIGGGDWNVTEEVEVIDDDDVEEAMA
jgi:type VI secretion system secreted protein VgrG